MAKEFQQTVWDVLVEDECRRLVRAAVLEDLDRGQDWTAVSLVPMEAMGRAAIVARQQGVIAGLPAVRMVIDEMDRWIQFTLATSGGAAVTDGMSVERGMVLATIEGPARSLLTAERLMLNFLGRLSGIATLTQKFVQAVAGTKARIYDTRKTAPGWRRLEKYAVRQGGACNHRTGLFDAILIKDNHLAFGAGEQWSVVSGQWAVVTKDKGLGAKDTAPHSNPLLRGEGVIQFSPAQAVRHVRQFIGTNFPTDDPRREMVVEVEVDSLAQLELVLPERPDIVLLDNMSLEELRRAVEMRNALAANVQLEASGGVSLATVRSIAETGVDRISAGALTHSAISLDVALDWAI